MNQLTIRTKLSFGVALFSFLMFILILFFEEWAYGASLSKGLRALSIWVAFLCSSGIGFICFAGLGLLYKEQSYFDYESDPMPIKPVFIPEEKESDWELRESTFLGQLIPDLELKKVSGWDISAYPSSLRNPKSDYIRILPSKDGFMGLIAGFPDSDVISASQRLFVHGVISSAATLNLTTDDLMTHVEKSLHSLTLQGTKLSIFGFGKDREHLHFYHAMEMPVFQFSDRGIEVLEGTGQTSWQSGEKMGVSIADSIQVGDYLIWASDRVLSEFEVSPFEVLENFVDYLLDTEVSTSKDLLLAIAKRMKILGTERDKPKSVQNLSLIVVKRKR